MHECRKTFLYSSIPFTIIHFTAGIWLFSYLWPSLTEFGVQGPQVKYLQHLLPIFMEPARRLEALHGPPSALLGTFYGY